MNKKDDLLKIKEINEFIFELLKQEHVYYNIDTDQFIVGTVDFLTDTLIQDSFIYGKSNRYIVLGIL